MIDNDAGMEAERAQFLKKQAEWCIEMATRTANARLFQRYIELAAAYQQQPLDIEQRCGRMSAV